MLISPAYAQSAGGSGALESLLPLVLIFVVFYFLLIRPQQKKQKQHREMLQALRRGDRVVTAGGIIGQITKVNSETELTIEISEGVRVKVARPMISDILAKTEEPEDEPEEGPEEVMEKDSGEPEEKKAN
jgi:preprotein translocase subunit YajC